MLIFRLHLLGIENKRNENQDPKKEIFPIGRITYVPPSVGADYYLRVLLNVIPGPTSFEFLKTVNGVVYPEFKDA